VIATGSPPGAFATTVTAGVVSAAGMLPASNLAAIQSGGRGVMQLLENRVLALALAATLLLAAVPVGLAHQAGGVRLAAALWSPQRKSGPAATGNSQIYLPLVGAQSVSAEPPPANASWLDYVNYYRALAWLPPVSEDRALSIAAQQLAACVVASDKFHEWEWQFSPYCQPFQSFQKTAQASNIYVTSTPDVTDTQALAMWIQAPFHALGMLDPALRRVGFGTDRDSSGAVRMAAVLDVTSGRDSRAIPLSAFPAAWPGNGTTVGVGSYAADTDSPEPLSSCPGYPAVTGLPIILQLGDGGLPTVDVSDSSLQAGGVSLEHCVFTQNSYVSLDADEQAAGRALLAARNAIILLPKEPLGPGTLYTVSVTANGRTYQWSFRVAGS
jgi:uncharacterized protein YkwD